MDRMLKHKTLIFITSAMLLNAVLLLIAISFYNCVYATNDDYRMSLIVSGAYTGEASANLVFMRYPIAAFISGLYRMTAAVPWYGICTMLCIYIPICIIAFFVFRESYNKNRLGTGIVLYLLFYLFVAQKHIILPQFTATAAFMAVAWVALLWFMPSKRNTFYIIFTSLIATMAFCIRMKIFFMLVPVGILIVAARAIFGDEKDKKHLKMCIYSCVLAVILCAGSYASDYINYDKDYKEFNTARSNVYDFGALPPYDMNKEFYDESGIDESTFYCVSARHLDMDEQITTDNLQDIVEFINHKDSQPIVLKCLNALFGSLICFFDSAVVYQSLFAFFTILLAIVMSFKRKKQYIAITAIATLIGMLLEMSYFVFRSRVMDRFTEVFLLTLSVIGLVACVRMFENGEIKAEQTCEKSLCLKWLYKTIAGLCIVVVTVCAVFANQNNLSSKSKHQNLVNSRLEELNALAENYPDSFYFYDAYDFIGASADVFSVYDNLVNTDSLGSWYINSQDYFKRNNMFGFEHAIEGLTDGGKNVYFAAIGNLKNGIILLLKERYDMEAVIVDTIPYENNNIYIYTFVPCG